MRRDMAYRVNAPQVISEIIEGELVMINLERGTYYSAEGAGAAIWELLEAGMPVGEVVASSCTAFSAEPDEVEPAVVRFLNRLIEEELIVPAEAGSPASRRTVADRPSADAMAFEPPVLNVYTDMADILLLDPVHDVDETGWPRPKSGSEAP